MSFSRTKTRIQKLLFSLVRPSCWQAFAIGVAPSIEHIPMLRSLDIDGIIDVGANRGQFSLACRIALPGKPIVAFEPIPAEARKYRSIHGATKNIALIETALGDATGEARLHLSQSADSSSLLAIGKRQTDLFPGTREVDVITVPVERLDNLASNWQGRTRQLLKLDVQGFELNVLRGGAETLKSCAFVYAECSEEALYEGQALRPEVSGYLAMHGFKEFARYNATFDGVQLVQADYLYVR
jgi:FkbM family methyltransferase